MGRSNFGSDPLQVVSDFVASVLRRSETIFVGIDPGSTGAIGFLCGSRATAIDIPTEILKVKRSKKTTDAVLARTGKKTRTVKGSKTVFNYHDICMVFSALRPVRPRVVIVLEDVPTSLGPGKRHAEIMLNRAWAMWPLFLYSRGFSVEPVTPMVWKSRMGLRGQTKAHSRRKAISMWPRAPLNLVKHHDRAEALLMAAYTQRQHAGKS